MISWLLGLFLAAVIYYIVCKLFPPRQTFVPETITGEEEAALLYYSVDRAKMRTRKRKAQMRRLLCSRCNK